MVCYKENRECTPNGSPMPSIVDKIVSQISGNEYLGCSTGHLLQNFHEVNHRAFISTLSKIQLQYSNFKCISFNILAGYASSLTNRFFSYVTKFESATPCGQGVKKLISII